MSAEDSGLSELDVDVFGPLVSISIDSLICLATKIQNEALGTQSSSGSLVARVGGSYNIAHIIRLDNRPRDDLRLVIRVPASGWGTGLTGTAASAIRSQVTALRLIKRETTIPVPDIYAFDVTCDNEIGAPYICMSFMPGVQASKAWFEDIDPAKLENRRLRTLTSLAPALAQLSNFAFREIGSLQDAEGELVLGPCYDWRENDDNTLSVVASGPYPTISAYLQENTQPTAGTGVWTVAVDKIMDVVVPCLLSIPNDAFVLSVPDFDSQNILVDDEGNVTGIIDWDHVQTMPRWVGYTRYPSWITRDWDPLMYGWPKMKESENSPEELERYRAHYDREMGAAMGYEGDWAYTRKSHVREAVWIAALNSMNRLEICRKMVEAVVETRQQKQGEEGAVMEEVEGGKGHEEEYGEDGVEGDALDILYDLGAGYLSEQKWRRLKQELVALVS